jgi:hypothetical protein
MDCSCNGRFENRVKPLDCSLNPIVLILAHGRRCVEAGRLDRLFT